VKEELIKDRRRCRNNSKDVPADCLEKGDMFVHVSDPLFTITAVRNISQKSVSRTK
jgi:hypothetical protein